MKYKGLYDRKFDNHQGCLIKLCTYDLQILLTFMDIPKTVLRVLGDEMAQLGWCTDYSVSDDVLVMNEPSYMPNFYDDMMDCIKGVLEEHNYLLEIKPDIINTI